jgi:hypothetical protein
MKSTEEHRGRKILHGLRLIDLQLCCRLASWPDSVSTMDGSLRKDLYAGFTDSLDDYDSLLGDDLPMTTRLISMLPKKKPAVAELERLRKGLRNVFGQIHSERKTIAFPTTSGSLVFHKQTGRRFYASRDWFSLMIANVEQLLGEFGLDAVRRCPECDNYFISVRPKKFCSRQCNEATKRRRPERREYQALLMRKRNWSKANNRTPSAKLIAEWRETYRQKRRQQQSPTRAT